MARYLHPIVTGTYDYSCDTLDGDATNLSYLEPIPTRLQKFDPRTIFGGGARVSSVNMPTRVRLEGRKRKLPDIANQLHMYFVTRPVIDVIEGFQKEIQYFPVEAVWKDGSEAGQFFFLFTTVLLDTVNRKMTTLPWQNSPPGSAVAGHWLYKEGATFVFDKSKIGNTHFWKDPHYLTAKPLVSDALFEALKKAKFQAFQNSRPFEEI